MINLMIYDYKGSDYLKPYLLRAIKIFCFVLLVAVCVGFLQEYVLCHADHNRERLKGFYQEDKDSLDVVYMGASDVYSDVAPGYAYRRDGITSYIFATQANSILNYKSQLKNVLSRQKDAIIVVELNGALYDTDEDMVKEANLRNYGDNVPLDAIKLGWIAQNVPENKLEYLFPIMKYHSVWSTLEDEQKMRDTVITDQKRGYDYLKGILNWTLSFQSPEPSLNSKLAANAEKRQPLCPGQEEELRNLLEFCRREGMKNIVFARFPHIVVRRTFSRFERSNTVGDIVAEYGYDYLNFERDFALTGLDEEKDFYNLDHLNVYGQKKFTAFLTDYLTKRYGVTPREQSAKCRREWDTCADYYDAYFAYSDSLIKKGERRELSEDCELIETLNDYLPRHSGG